MNLIIIVLLVLIVGFLLGVINPQLWNLHLRDISGYHPRWHFSHLWHGNHMSIAILLVVLLVVGLTFVWVRRNRRVGG
jgi:uncharacterized membrane protein YedE/YeeE